MSCICFVSYPIRFQLLRYVSQTGYYALTFSLLNVVAMDFSTVRVYQIIVQKSGRIPWTAGKASTIKRQHKLRGKQNSNLQSQISSTTDCTANGNCILYSSNSHSLVLCPSHVSEKVGINQKGVIKNDIPIIFTHFICCDMYRDIMLSDNCHHFLSAQLLMLNEQHVC